MIVQLSTDRLYQDHVRWIPVQGGIWIGVNSDGYDLFSFE